MVVVKSPVIDVLGQVSDEQRTCIARALVKVDAAMFPPLWQYETPQGFYEAALANSDSVVLLLKDGGEIVGHLLAVPLKSALQDIVPFDPEVRTANCEGYYIDTVAALPCRSVGSLRKLLDRLGLELRRRNIPTLAMHARVSSGLSRVVQKYFTGAVLMVRRIDRWEWYAREEAADFIEVALGQHK